MVRPKRLKLILILPAGALCLLFLLLYSDQSRKRRIIVKKQYLLMGTLVEIQLVCPASGEEAALRAIRAAREEISRLEDLMSPYRPESDISRVNREAALHPVVVSTDTFQVLKRSLAVSEKTDGAFDISFAPVGRLWRLDPENPRIPTGEEIESTLALVDFRNILLDGEKRSVAFAREGMAIDLGGIAKGTAVNRAVKVVRGHGFEDVLVNAGGDLFALGKNAEGKPWRIGIRDPRDKTRFIEKIEVSDRAVVTSGDYERMVEIEGTRYHHIMDTKTGRPAEKCISVTIVSGDPELADALSTALFVLGPEKGLELVEQMPDVEALIVDPALAIHATKGFDIPPGKTLQ